MKYQITCDNCGSKFIIDAEEGSTVECKCFHCGGIMDITLPIVGKDQEYIPHKEPSYDKPYTLEKAKESHSAIMLWSILGVLLFICVCAGVYFYLQPSGAEQPVQPQTTVMDTIPYEQPEPEPTTPPVPDTVETAPQVKQEEKVSTERKEQYLPTDSTQTENSSDQE